MKPLLLFFLSILGFGTTQAQMIGTYTVDPGQSASSTNFTSIEAAFDSLHNQGVSGPVTINIANGTYTGMLTLESIGSTSATKRVRIRAASGNPGSVVIQASINSSQVVMSWQEVSFTTLENIHLEVTSSDGFGFGIIGNSSNDSLIGCTFQAGTGVGSAVGVSDGIIDSI